MSQFELSKFHPEPDREFICGICMNILDAPYETSCRHVFCRDCIGTALKKNPKCPVCRAACREDQTKEVIPLVQNLINKLTMICDNQEYGCTELIQKEFYLDHLKSCEYVMVQCRYKECGQYLVKKDCVEHETKICAYRDHLCQAGCGLMIPVENLETHNCIESLLKQMKDLQEKNSELQKQVDELREVLSALENKPEPVLTPRNHELSSSISSIDDSSLSAHSFSSLEAYADIDLSDLDEQENTRTSPRRSRRIAASSQTSEILHNEDLSSDESQDSQTLGISDSESDNRHVDDSEIHDEGNDLEVPEYHAVEEIDNFSEDDVCILNRENNVEFPAGQVVEEIPSSSDDKCFASNGNGISTNMSASVSYSQSVGMDTTAQHMLLFSGDIVLDGERNFTALGKRHLDDNVEDSEVKNTGKRVKTSRLSPENKEDHNNEVFLLSEVSSGSTVSFSGPLAESKKHPHGHKKTIPKTSADARSSAPNNSSISFVGNEQKRTYENMSSADGTFWAHTSGPDSPDGASPVSPSSDNRNEWSSSASESGPITRSRRQDQHIALENEVIKNVRVPCTAAYLLDKYAQESDSDDGSWSPTHDN